MVAGCTGASPTGVPRSSTQPSSLASPTPLVEVGVNGGSLMIVSDDEVLTKSLDAMSDLGVTMLRLDIAWPIVEPVQGMLNWAPIDRVVDAARKRGIRVIGIVDYTPQWESGTGNPIAQRPSSVSEFARFAGDVAEHFDGRLAGYEIWNEPNGSYFFRPGPDPEYYTRMLRSAYRAIKAVDPDNLVIGGSLATAVDSNLTMNGLRFLKRMYAAGAGGYFDALAVHPYSYPDSFSADPLDPVSAMRMVSDMYAQMRAHGDGDKKMWATEMGYPTRGDLPSDTKVQSDVVTQSVKEWSQLSYAGPAIIHELRDRAAGTGDREDSFGILATDFTPKPLYKSLRTLLGQHVVDDPTYRRLLGSAEDSGLNLGGPVTPWYRSASRRGIPQLRQEFVNGLVICTSDDCYASPAPVGRYLDRAGATPVGPFVDGQQIARGVRLITVFYSPRSGAHSLSGEMLDRWRPEYGFPMTDEYIDGNSRVVRCEHAVMRKVFGEPVVIERA